MTGGSVLALRRTHLMGRMEPRDFPMAAPSPPEAAGGAGVQCKRCRLHPQRLRLPDAPDGFAPGPAGSH